MAKGDAVQDDKAWLDEIDQDARMLGNLDWLMENSEGVVGLRLDGGVMPWAEVREKYLPASKNRAAPPRAITVRFSGGPWGGTTREVEKVVGPVFAPGDEVGNHYWLDTKMDPPTYFWNVAG